MSEFHAQAEANIILALREINNKLSEQSTNITRIMDSLYGDPGESEGLSQRVRRLENDFSERKGISDLFKWALPLAAGGAGGILSALIGAGITYLRGG